jgi:hypothetical protein
VKLEKEGLNTINNKGKDPNKAIDVAVDDWCGKARL